MILNIAFYRFVRLGPDEMSKLRAELKEQCRKRGLLGSILLAPEGINASLAGDERSVRGFQEHLACDPRFAGVEYKESISSAVPFKHLFVKLKKEIIPMSRETDPAQPTGKRLPPRELKRWFDEGRPFTLIDTRNDYEIEHGTFVGAADFGLKNFRNFPAVLGERQETLRGSKRPIVMFCTGGIRCEKATAFALEEGLEDVYQLEGGILRYFAECGGEHYRGRCYVFDEREAIGPESVKPS